MPGCAGFCSIICARMGEPVFGEAQPRPPAPRAPSAARARARDETGAARAGEGWRVMRGQREPAERCGTAPARPPHNRPGSSLARTGTGFIRIIIFPEKTEIGLPRGKKKKEKKELSPRTVLFGNRVLVAQSSARCRERGRSRGERRGCSGACGGIAAPPALPARDNPELGHRARPAGAGHPRLWAVAGAAWRCRRIPGRAGRVRPPPHSAVPAAGCAERGALLPRAIPGRRGVGAGVGGAPAGPVPELPAALPNKGAAAPHRARPRRSGATFPGAGRAGGGAMLMREACPRPLGGALPALIGGGRAGAGR